MTAHHACSNCGHRIVTRSAGIALRAICTGCGLETLITRDDAQRRRETQFLAAVLSGERPDLPASREARIVNANACCIAGTG